VFDVLAAVAGVALIVGMAVFVAAEFALVTLEPAQLEGDGLAPRSRAVVARAMRRLSTQLCGTQIGITLTTILLGFTTQPALARILTRAWTGPLAHAGAAALAGVVAVVLVNAAAMVGGEMAPKNLALTQPLRTAGKVAWIVVGFTALARPFVAILRGSASLLLRLVGVEVTEELSGTRTAPELASLVRRSAAQGVLDSGLASRLEGSLSLSQLRAIDVMTDRTALVVVDRAATATDVLAAARSSGHSTFPVCEGTKDEVVGLVRLRRAVAVPHERRAEVPVTALMDPVLRVPETAGLGPVLTDLRAAGTPMALVVDEYGGTSGVLTVEDVVEEIVGEVADEHDATDTAAPRRRSDGSWLVSGLLRPDELQEATGIRLPEHPAYETLGGLVMHALERIPRRLDSVEIDGTRLTVETMEGRRVALLAILPPTHNGGGER